MTDPMSSGIHEKQTQLPTAHDPGETKHGCNCLNCMGRFKDKIDDTVGDRRGKLDSIYRGSSTNEVRDSGCVRCECVRCDCVRCDCGEGRHTRTA